MPRDDSLIVVRNSWSFVSTSTSTDRDPTAAAAETFSGLRAGRRPVPSLMIVEPFSDVSMTMCSALRSSGFAAVSFADSASAIKRSCWVALSTSLRRPSPVTVPLTTWKTSSSPTSAWISRSSLPARRMPIVSGERFFASRSASTPLIPGRSCAEMMTLMGVSPSVVRASLPLVAQCTV